MFTGIISELGRVRDVRRQDDAAVLTVEAPEACATARPGDSISVNGVCLTALPPAPDVPLSAGSFRADVMGETLARTTLGSARPGTPVDIETALRPSDRLGGHVVQGHVDATAPVLAVAPHPRWRVLRIGLPAEIVPLVAYKGSIAVDGVSLTVSAVGDAGDGGTGDAWFEISLIPETLQRTVLGGLSAGDLVNLESDVLARQVRRLIEQGIGMPPRTEERNN
jgi:riboflavin synthase